MVLVVETGAGLSTAEAYASVAEYEAYWALRGGIPSTVTDAYATGVLVMPAQPTDGDTITIDGVAYTFKTTLTSAAGDVLIGATVAATQNNLVAAVNATAGGAGSTYGSLTVAHPTVSAGAFASAAATFTARTAGTAGDSIATTETFTSSANVWQAATLSGAATALEVRLRKATARLDHEAWKGTRVGETQALDWPRAYVEDDDGFTVDSDIVPTRVKNATIILASKDTATLTVDVSPGQGGTIKSESKGLGPLRKTVTYDNASAAGSQTVFVEVAALIRGLVRKRPRGIGFARMGA